MTANSGDGKWHAPLILRCPRPKRPKPDLYIVNLLEGLHLLAIAKELARNPPYKFNTAALENITHYLLALPKERGTTELL